MIIEDEGEFKNIFPLSHPAQLLVRKDAQLLSVFTANSLIIFNVVI